MQETGRLRAEERVGASEQRHTERAARDLAQLHDRHLHVGDARSGLLERDGDELPIPVFERGRHARLASLPLRFGQLDRDQQIQVRAALSHQLHSRYPYRFRKVYRF